MRLGLLGLGLVASAAGCAGARLPEAEPASAVTATEAEPDAVEAAGPADPWAVVSACAARRALSLDGLFALEASLPMRDLIYELAIDGDTLAIGLGDRVLVYVRGDEGWAASQVLQGARYGRSLALNGDWLAVGAPRDFAQGGSGRVAVFHREGARFELARELTSSGRPMWGEGLAFAAGHLVVVDSGGLAEERPGRVELFETEGWTSVAGIDLPADACEVGQRIVAVDGELLLEARDCNTGTANRVVRVHREGSTWVAGRSDLRTRFLAQVGATPVMVDLRSVRSSAEPSNELAPAGWSWIANPGMANDGERLWVRGRQPTGAQPRSMVRLYLAHEGRVVDAGALGPPVGEGRDWAAHIAGDSRRVVVDDDYADAIYVLRIRNDIDARDCRPLEPSP